MGILAQIFIFLTKIPTKNRNSGKIGLPKRSHKNAWLRNGIRRVKIKNPPSSSVISVPSVVTNLYLRNSVNYD